MYAYIHVCVYIYIYIYNTHKTQAMAARQHATRQLGSTKNITPDVSGVARLIRSRRCVAAAAWLGAPDSTL